MLQNHKISHILSFIAISLILITGSNHQTMVGSQGIQDKPGSTVVLTETFRFEYTPQDGIYDPFTYSMTEVNDQIWTTDYTGGQLLIYSQTGEYIRNIGHDDLNLSSMIPTDIVNNGTHVLFVDAYFNEVIILDYSGSLVDSFSIAGSTPYVLDMEYNGSHFYLMEGSNEEIQIYDSAGNYLYNHTLSVGTASNIGLDGELIYVSNAIDGRIDVYNTTFDLQTSFGSFELYSTRDVMIHNQFIYVANETSVVVYNKNHQIKNIIRDYNGFDHKRVDQIKIIDDKLAVSTETSSNEGLFLYSIDLQDVSIKTGVDSIRVTWDIASTRNPDQVEYFHIYRGESPTDMDKIETVAADQSSYTDTVVEQNTTYYYAVSISNMYGETALSEPVSAKLSPGTGHDAMTEIDTESTDVSDTEGTGILSLGFLLPPTAIIAVILIRKYH